MLRVLTLLAEGDHTQQQIADMFGVSQARISQLNREHADRIQQMRDDADNEFAGLWVAHKKNRLANYQEDLDAIEAAIEQHKKFNADTVALVRLRDKIQRAVAEELGQIPNKMSVKSDNKHVRYTLEGIDPEDLD